MLKFQLIYMNELITNYEISTQFKFIIFSKKIATNTGSVEEIVFVAICYFKFISFSDNALNKVLLLLSSALSICFIRNSF